MEIINKFSKNTKLNFVKLSFLISFWLFNNLVQANEYQNIKSENNKDSIDTNKEVKIIAEKCLFFWDEDKFKIAEMAWIDDYQQYDYEQNQIIIDYLVDKYFVKPKVIIQDTSDNNMYIQDTIWQSENLDNFEWEDTISDQHIDNQQIYDQKILESDNNQIDIEDWLLNKEQEKEKNIFEKYQEFWFEKKYIDWLIKKHWFQKINSILSNMENNKNLKRDKDKIYYIKWAFIGLNKIIEETKDKNNN